MVVTKFQYDKSELTDHMHSPHAVLPLQMMELHEISTTDSVEQDDAASVLKKLPLVAEVTPTRGGV